mmetsp:Transcript_24067/g.71331  ORF Transcript_24067/g.71331 Transcript_24067/m.71331 type:complete len:235 (+) Transcript_24067:154-858(+)
MAELMRCTCTTRRSDRALAVPLRLLPVCSIPSRQRVARYGWDRRASLRRLRCFSGARQSAPSASLRPAACCALLSITTWRASSSAPVALAAPLLLRPAPRSSSAGSLLPTRAPSPELRWAPGWRESHTRRRRCASTLRPTCVRCGPCAAASPASEEAGSSGGAAPSLLWRRWRRLRASEGRRRTTLWWSASAPAPPTSPSCLACRSGRAAARTCTSRTEPGWRRRLSAGSTSCR